MQTQNLKKKKKKRSYSSLTFNTIEEMKTESKTLSGEKKGKLNIFISFSLLSRSASHIED